MATKLTTKEKLAKIKADREKLDRDEQLLNVERMQEWLEGPKLKEIFGGDTKFEFKDLKGKVTTLPPFKWLFLVISEHFGIDEISDVDILAAIGKAAGMKNIKITQEKAAQKAARGPSKPRTPESIALTKAGNAAKQAEIAVHNKEVDLKAATTQHDKVRIKAELSELKEKAVALREKHTQLKEDNKKNRKNK